LNYSEINIHQIKSIYEYPLWTILWSVPEHHSVTSKKSSNHKISCGGIKQTSKYKIFNCKLENLNKNGPVYKKIPFKLLSFGCLTYKRENVLNAWGCNVFWSFFFGGGGREMCLVGLVLVLNFISSSQELQYDRLSITIISVNFVESNCSVRNSH
jgi:hypothetical protein